jgi:hypothetical protein
VRSWAWTDTDIDRRTRMRRDGAGGVARGLVWKEISVDRGGAIGYACVHRVAWGSGFADERTL